MGYSPWGRKESDTTEATKQQQHRGVSTPISSALFLLTEPSSPVPIQ